MFTNVTSNGLVRCPLCNEVYSHLKKHLDLGHNIYDEMYEKFKKDNPEICFTSEEFKKKAVIASTRSQHVYPNKPESYLIFIIDKYNLDFQFTGNGEFWIGNKNPDFTSTNGKNVVIEMFGDYWHGEGIKGKTKEEHEQEIIQYYSKHNYDCKILWEHEVYKLSEQELVKALI